jgi:hypothetical protein
MLIAKLLLPVAFVNGVVLGTAMAGLAAAAVVCGCRQCAKRTSPNDAPDRKEAQPSEATPSG